MSAPQLREEDGITFVLLDGELDKLSVTSEGSQGEFCFEEVTRGLASPVSLDSNDFVRSDSLDNLSPLDPNTTLTTAPPQPQHQQKRAKGKRRANNKRTHASSSEWRVVNSSPFIKLPLQRDPQPMPLKNNKTHTIELITEYDIVGGGDANNIYFALEDTGKLNGLREVFKTYKFMRVVANFSLKYGGPVKGNIYTSLLLKDSKIPTAEDILTMKKDATCMEVDMASATQFTRSLTPRYTHKKGTRALNEWLPIMPSSNVTWFGIKYITDPTPATSCLYLVSLKYTIAFRA